MVQGPLSIARLRSQLSMYVLLITIESRDIKRDNAAQHNIVISVTLKLSESGL